MPEIEPAANATIGRICATLAYRDSVERVAAKAFVSQCFEKRRWEVTAEDIRTICNRWETTAQNTRRGLSQNTRRSYVNALRRILEKCGCYRGAFEGLTRPARAMPRNVTAEDADFEAVLVEADPRLRLLLLCCRDAGLRISAALRLTASSIVTRHDGTVVVEGRAKRGSSFEVPITDRLALELQYAASRTKSSDEFLIQAVDRERRILSRNYVGTLLRVAKRKAGVTAKWTLHDLRRTAARSIYRVTGDVRKAQRFLGHTSTNATLWYLQDPLVTLSKEEVEEASRKVRTNAEPAKER